MGHQVLSNKQTAPGARFGRSERDAAARTYISREHDKSGGGSLNTTPGPITAEQKSAMGNQVCMGIASLSHSPIFIAHADSSVPPHLPCSLRL